MNFVIKVADFGLSESVGTKQYFRQDKSVIVKLPVRWLAPESLEDYIFSQKSDVVSIPLTIGSPCSAIPMQRINCMYSMHSGLME